MIWKGDLVLVGKVRAAYLDRMQPIYKRPSFKSQPKILKFCRFWPNFVYKRSYTSFFARLAHFYVIFRLDILESFSSCSLDEISKFHLTENKANAHVNTFNRPPLAASLGVFRQAVVIASPE